MLRFCGQMDKRKVLRKILLKKIHETILGIKTMRHHFRVMTSICTYIYIYIEKKYLFIVYLFI